MIALFPGKLRGRDERSVREYRMGLGSPKLLRDEDDPGPISSPGPMKLQGFWRLARV